MNRVLAITMAIVFSLPAWAWADESIPGVGLKPVDKGDKKQSQQEDEITILGKRILKDSELVGDYKQPMWTASRRFASTRVYVMPSGATTFEYWLQADGDLKSDSAAKFKSSYELELGLGNHLQLDLYICNSQAAGYSPLKIDAEKIELRWAPWDWSEIWGNPAIYLEWIRQHQGPQKGEVKLLLGDSFTSRLFWGFNLVYERELGADSEQEYAASFGTSYALVDGILALGLEGKVAMADVNGSRFDFDETELLLGPSLQVRPIPGVHIDLLTLFGARIEDETEAVYTVFLIVGKDWLVF